MNWIKKFAQWLLSEELAEERKHYQKINDDLRADKEITENEGERGAIVYITDYNINIFIPLRKENVSYKAYDVQTAIETFFWDFYGAGIRMLSGEAWALAAEFIRAQNNVLSEFRQEGLL